MKLVVRSLVFHILCILVFSLIYESDIATFEHDHKENETYLDYLLMSTSLQCGAGFINFYPQDNISKLLSILQLFMMISAHIITIYFFTL
jgi:hypothetical protein